MRAKNIDEILPRLSIQLTDTDDIVVDGARTKLVNGAVTQNGLELIERIRQEYKAMGEALKAAEGRVIKALKDGVTVQDGNRRANMKVTERSNPKYKDAFADASGIDPKTQPDEWEEALKGFSSVSRSERLEID